MTVDFRCITQFLSDVAIQNSHLIFPSNCLGEERGYFFVQFDKIPPVVRKMATLLHRDFAAMNNLILQKTSEIFYMLGMIGDLLSDLQGVRDIVLYRLKINVECWKLCKSAILKRAYFLRDIRLHHMVHRLVSYSDPSCMLLGWTCRGHTMKLLRSCSFRSLQNYPALCYLSSVSATRLLISVFT